MSETASRLLELLSLLQARRRLAGRRAGGAARGVRAHDPARRRAPSRPRLSGRVTDRTGRLLPAFAPAPRCHPLLLDEDEAIAIAVGLRTAARASVTGIEESSIRALVKLEQVLPAHLRRRVGALASATIAPAVTGPTVDPQHLTVIAGAARLRMSALRLSQPRRQRHAPRGRAPLARQPRAPLVPRGLGSPP